eukprot:TRINITY_DN18166_c0_g1_i1.p1 TRINITY_DN18166_c0_g1~~TRINITY_DN18166_c0_g1_i1.p1  ORF type:complete len:781 (-),score=273.46 TRINITY_DN18166_c0_g1_i1:262-2604(-)
MGGKRKRGNKGKGKGSGKAAGDGSDAEGAAAGQPEAKKAKGGKGESQQDYWREQPGSYTKDNAEFEAYYKKQAICPDSEWATLLEHLKSGLPASLRVNCMRVGAKALMERLADMVEACKADADRECYAPERLEWYNGLAWQWKSLERKTIKKDARHAHLKDYLAERERSGLLTRQEVVSMLPPLFLDIEPHHRVLDLCAAPGSKTTQMLEVMHAAHAKGGPPPTGMVVANELQWKRANMLAHQVGRLGSPCALVANMDAQFFPDLWIDEKPFRFDRILADVPCSGDGTMRKTPYIWKSWTWKDGFALHLRQLNILYRGLEMLDVGGRLVYSTCSLNPLEDEAVIAAALLKHGDSLRVLPRPAHLASVRAAQGLTKWSVPSPREEKVYYDKYADVPEELRGGKMRILPSMFAPADDAEFDDIRKQIREGCNRCLPHLMDTGGFFVTIFEKVKELKPSAKARRLAARAEIKAKRAAAEKAEAQEAAAAKATGDEAAAAEVAAEDAVDAADDDDDEVEGEAEPDAEGAAGDSAALEAGKPPGKLWRITREYLEVEEEWKDEWKVMRDFYGLEDSVVKRLYARGKAGRQIFLQSEAGANFLHAKVRLPTRMVMCGVLAFQHSDSCHVDACEWLLRQDALITLCSLGMKRKIALRRPLLQKLLEEQTISLEELKAAAQAGDATGLEALAPPGGAAGALRPGCLAVQLLPETAEAVPPFAVCAQIGDEALECSIPKAAERHALLGDLRGQPSVEEILGPAVELAAEETAEKKEQEDTPMATDAGAA